MHDWTKFGAPASTLEGVHTPVLTGDAADKVSGEGVFSERGRRDTSSGTQPGFGPDFDWGSTGPSAQFLQLYRSGEYLAHIVGGFLAAPLTSGGCAIAIATPELRDQLRIELSTRGIALQSAEARGQLVMVDASETLASMIVDGSPDPARFRETVGRAVAALARGGRRVHAFGEMVALLWQGGRRDAAAQLQGFWKELVREEPFAHLCAFPIEGFAGRDDAADYRAVCGHQAWVLPVEATSVVVAADAKRSERDRAMLAAIVESSQDAIVSKSLEGIILSWNAGAERLFGYTEAEAVGRSITMVIPPDRIEEETEILSRVRHGERVESFETVRVTKDGQLIDISLTVSPVRDSAGSLIGASKIARDITQRRQALQALRESEERYRHLTELLREQKDELQALLDTLPVAVMIAEDPACLRISGNRAAAQLLRIPLGANLSMSAPPDELPESFRASRKGEAISPSDLPIQRAARGEFVVGEEVEILFLDGSVVHTVISARPLYDGQGAPRGAVAAVLDVTEARRSEQALRDADRRKDEFLATLAHELRNPLAPIRAGLELLRMEGAGEVVAPRAREIVERQMDHLTRLVDDLMDVSRITRDKIGLRRELIDISDVIESAVDQSRSHIDRAHHHLSVSMPDEPVFIHADPIRIAQILSNLLNNSAKYTDPGGQIFLVARPEDGWVTFTVEDNGIGIASELLPNVFDMFLQADVSQTRSVGGLGVGLNLVRRLVQMHEGTVEAWSEGPGHGSRFTVRLPRALQPGSAAQEETNSASGLRRRRILIADDNEDSVFTLSAWLRVKGHKVWTARNGAEAVDLAQEFRPEAILMDIGMPRMNGLEATRRIRALPGGDSILILALTGWGQPEDMERSKDAGFSGHLTKPVDFGRLEKILSGEFLDDPTLASSMERRRA